MCWRLIFGTHIFITAMTTACCTETIATTYRTMLHVKGAIFTGESSHRYIIWYHVVPCQVNFQIKCDNFIMKGFSERFKELREKTGMSQRELAKELNVSHAAIGRWESGARKPDAESLYKLSQYFEVSIEYLMGY